MWHLAVKGVSLVQHMRVAILQLVLTVCLSPHIFSKWLQEKKQLKLRKSVYQYTKISEGILEDIKALSFKT